MIDSFMDVFFIWSRSQVVAARHLRRTKEAFLAKPKNPYKKSFTASKQQLNYLGVELDLQALTVSLPHSW